MRSLSLLVGLVPLLSLLGLLCSALLEQSFPEGCSSSSSLCFYSLLLPACLPVLVCCRLCSWTGLKLFRHN